MGEKKFEGVRDLLYLKKGDIIVWPAETGKVIRLHGSVSTMRKLGFSVGRRWNAASYEQLKATLQDDPKRVRFLLVVSTREDVCSRDDVSLSIDRPQGTRVKEVTVRELPLRKEDLKDGTFDKRAWELTHSEELMRRVHSRSTFDIGLYFQGDRDDAFLEQALEDIEEWPWRDSDYNPETPDHTRRIERMDVGTNAWRNVGTRPSYDKFTDAVQAAALDPDADWSQFNEHSIDIPNVVLDNVQRLGVKALRPTEYGWSVIAERYWAYYCSMVSKRYGEMFERVKRVYRKLASKNVTLKVRGERFHAEAYRSSRMCAKDVKEACDVLERK